MVVPNGSRSALSANEGDNAPPRKVMLSALRRAGVALRPNLGNAVSMRTLAGLILGLFLAVLGASVAHAQLSTDEYYDRELADALDASGLLGEWLDSALTRPSLSLLPVAGSAWEDGRAAFIDVLDAEQAAVARWVSTAASQSLTEQEMRLLSQDEDAARQYIADLEQDIDLKLTARERLLNELTATDATLQEIAVARYMGGRLASELQPLRGTEPVQVRLNRQTLLSATDRSYEDLRLAQRLELEAMDAELRQAADVRDVTVRALIEIGNQQLEANDTVESLDSTVTDLESGSLVLLAEARDMIPRLQQLRATSTVSRLGFSLIAFDAYLQAAESMRDEPAACALDWATIAAIGDIESIHGTLGSRSISSNGNLSRPLLGVLLDGGASEAGADGEPTSNGFRAVPDSDDGVLDGSAEFDRALGPMQFLPSTWRIAGVDGNDDGVADPQNIHDAASAAAHYLCLVRADANSDELADRLRRYNDSSAYVNEVLATAETLRSILPEATSQFPA